VTLSAATVRVRVLHAIHSHSLSPQNVLPSKLGHVHHARKCDSSRIVLKKRDQNLRNTNTPDLEPRLRVTYHIFSSMQYQNSLEEGTEREDLTPSSSLPYCAHLRLRNLDAPSTSVKLSWKMK